ncbi:conserved hypothetical protein [Ixodes scapularis]|uniref:UBC core domain-containing protein n=1 Tax=Ixodes scapularis TaxID=6945 RepID=B7P1D8_IXOSC|nr:conserved hypothetical protein [Ixodes scapularis]|eukprot:XP_002433346.1 conserved hypothetical protein [Ixodes scapularis]
MAASALKKLFRTDRHRLSTSGNSHNSHNDLGPKKKKESGEGGSRARLLGLCAGAGKAGELHSLRPPQRAPGTLRVVARSVLRASWKFHRTSDVSIEGMSFFRDVSQRLPRHRVAPCSQQAAVRARRLMREFHEIRRQQGRGQAPSFTVDLVDDNLYEWHVRLYQAGC